MGIVKEFQYPRIERQGQRIQLEKSRQSSPELSSDAAFNKTAVREQFYALNKIFEVHDWLYAYWKVTYPRSVDNIITQVVGICLAQVDP